jgi:tetratricopeptide (TPR) repeat protein
MLLGALVSCVLLAGTARADETTDKGIKTLNELTGLAPTQGMLRHLIAHPDEAKRLIDAALPLAQPEKEGLSYNAALVLAWAAAEQKDLKATDTFFHVCGRLAARAKSTDKLVQSYLTLIKLYYANRQYGDCARVSRELISLKTDDKTPRLVYKAFTDERGDTDFNEYPQFGTVTPGLKFEAERYLALALAKQGKHSQALKLADGMIRNPNDWYAKSVKAAVLRDSGELEDAAKLYEDLLPRAQRDSNFDAEERDEMVETLQNELSNIYVELNQIDKAAGLLETLLKKHPNEPGYYNDLGYILADHDMRLDDAEKMIRKALELDKERRAKSDSFNPKTDHDNGAYLDSLGWVLYKKKQYGEARKYLEQAVEDKNAKHIEIYDHLGDVCHALGDREAAIRAWEEGLKHVTDTRRDQQRRTAVERKLDRAKSKSAQK